MKQAGRGRGGTKRNAGRRSRRGAGKAAAGSVLGIGVDLVETARMARMLKKWGEAFKDRVFLPGERAYCEAAALPTLHYAGRFAVKEAVSKAFGTGIGPHLGLLDIEVARDGKTGAPSVRLSASGRKFAGRMGVSTILVSLSHTHRYAVAQAVLVGNGR